MPWLRSGTDTKVCRTHSETNERCLDTLRRVATIALSVGSLKSTQSLYGATSLSSYLVSFGSPQRKEAGKEELAPADDSSQAPVEASHARPVLSASLLSRLAVPGIGSCNRL